MTIRSVTLPASALLGALLMAAPAFAQIDARMFRYPDVSGTHITFVYAEDIWIVEKTGGEATRVTHHPDSDRLVD